MWAIFTRSRNPEINELMTEGVQCMENSGEFEKALQIFNKILQLDPQFSEVRSCSSNYDGAILLHVYPAVKVTCWVV